MLNHNFKKIFPFYFLTSFRPLNTSHIFFGKNVNISTKQLCTTYFKSKCVVFRSTEKKLVIRRTEQNQEKQNVDQILIKIKK